MQLCSNSNFYIIIIIIKIEYFTKFDNLIMELGLMLQTPIPPVCIYLKEKIN